MLAWVMERGDAGTGDERGDAGMGDGGGQLDGRKGLRQVEVPFCEEERAVVTWQHSFWDQRGAGAPP